MQCMRCRIYRMRQMRCRIHRTHRIHRIHCMQKRNLMSMTVRVLENTPDKRSGTQVCPKCFFTTTVNRFILFYWFAFLIKKKWEAGLILHSKMCFFLATVYTRLWISNWLRAKQNELNWRNLEGYPAQPGLICSSVRHSVHPSVRAQRGIWSKRVFRRMNGNFSFSVRWRNTTIIH